MEEKELKYKGFIGSVDFDKTDNTFYGSVTNVFGLVSYEADNIDNIQSAFEESVNDYIEIVKSWNNVKLKK